MTLSVQPAAAGTQGRSLLRSLHASQSLRNDAIGLGLICQTSLDVQDPDLSSALRIFTLHLSGQVLETKFDFAGADQENLLWGILSNHIDGRKQ